MTIRDLSRQSLIITNECKQNCQTRMHGSTDLSLSLSLSLSLYLSLSRVSHVSIVSGVLYLCHAR